jgi:tetratricopeptide (TPR) repeat protein
VRNLANPAPPKIVEPILNPSRLHRITDPDAGDTLLVVTALPPVRGFLKREHLVDLTLLNTAQGIAIRQSSNGISVKLAPDKVIISKPGGLVLSPVDVSAERAPTAVRPIFEIDEWRKNRAGHFSAREDELMTAAAEATPQQRWKARLALARFYVARGMYAEAEGETELMLADPTPKMDKSRVLMVHAIAAILMGRPEEGLKDLASRAIGDNYDSELWKGLAYAREGKWVEAQAKLKNVELGIASLPLELQRIITAEAMRASLEVKDFAGAARLRSELDVVGVSAEMKPMVSVLYGRLAEALGHDKDALDDYHFAIASSNSEAAAAAKLREIALRERRGEISQAEELRELETLEVTWRGDSTEVDTLQMLARIYSQTGRFAESLAAARAAIKLQPKSAVSQKAEDEAAALFAQIFRTKKGDKLSPINALALFYRFRELTPIGPIGDEIIRRLAGRLVAVDLLDQAAKLAMVYLADRKPEQAIAALNSTRIADLNGELRAQRLLLESRAQSEIGRHDLALEIISHISGPVAVRLRSDIYWAARKWRQSAEQIELYYGNRWRDFKPLNAAEKADIIRAAIGYALANDTIGLARFREKYAPLMSEEADKRAFDIASKPTASDSPEFAEIAKMAASQDTLDSFLREMRARFPDATGRTSPTKSSEARSAGKSSLPQIAGIKRANVE